jgi:hypothetical protein
MPKLPSVEFSIATAMAIILFFLADKESPVARLGLLCLMGLLSLHAGLSLPWVTAPTSVALRTWRFGLVASIVLLGVSGFGIWVWPTKLDEIKASLRAVGDTDYRNLVAEVIQSLDPKAHIAVGNAIDGPDGFRKVDVEVRSSDKLIAVDVVDRLDNRKVGVESIDQADSKRADIKADAMVVCSNTGFDEIAIRKAKRIGISLIAVVKQGDQRARAVIQEEIYLRKVNIVPFSITFNAATKADGELVRKYLNDAHDVTYQGGSSASWLQQTIGAFITLHPALQDKTYVATFHLINPTEFSVQGHPVMLRALTIQFPCRTRWFSQVVELDAKSAVYDYIRGRFVFTPGPNALTIKGINFDTATPMASPPAVADLDFGLRTNDVQLALIEWNIPKGTESTIPKLDSLIKPEDLSLAVQAATSQ